MLVKNEKKIRKRIDEVLSESIITPEVDFHEIIDHYRDQSASILKTISQHQTPCYLVDRCMLTESLLDFRSGFEHALPRARHFYAMKANDHPSIVKEAVRQGFGIDVSSVREMKIALAARAENILFSGPGKTSEELVFASDHRAKVIINLDSFGELDRLALLTRRSRRRVRVGIRVSTSYHEIWSKFGIPLAELKRFWQRAKKYDLIDLQGIQFHYSSNPDPSRYQKMIREVGEYLSDNFSKAMLQEIRFVDFGGGFLPELAHGSYAHEFAQGRIIKAANDFFGKPTEFTEPYIPVGGVPVRAYAQEIAKALKRYMPREMDCDYYSEPGRIICNSSMVIALRVVDVKSREKIIVDGGINMVGWERFEDRYFPILNLTHPHTEERRMTIFGPLCTPHDLWGYACYTGKVEEGDVLVIPLQGAFTYSLAQNFIKAIPPVYQLI